MNFSDSYPVWSTGTDNSFNMNNKIPQYKESESGRNDQNSNHTLNTSEVPAWEHNDSSWVQNDMYKTGLETDSLNSGGETSSSQENLPIWSNAGQGESRWSTLGNSQEMWGTNEETPLWDSNPGTWDHDSATRLAEKLLQCQHMDTASFASGVDNESKDGSPMISQDGKTGQFISPNPRFKTEMCRPYQENGTCKYGEKCQFAHGNQEVRNVNRHPKYKTDLCRTYHSVGFCPYGPRCHFVHALDEVRNSPIQTPEKKPNGPVKQLPMFGGSGNDAWNFPSNANTPYQNDSKPRMDAAVTQLNKYFNMSGGRAILSSSSNDSSRSGSFCSDVDSNSLPSSSPPPESYCTSPNDVSRSLRLPIFSRIGNNA
jgi:hypothetical protein